MIQPATCIPYTLGLWLSWKPGKCLLVVLLCSLPISGLRAQSGALDSLDILLSLTSDKVQKTSLLWTALDQALDEDLHRAVSYAQALRQMEAVAADSSLWMEALRKEAYAERYLGNYVRAIEQCRQCHAYYLRSGDTTNLAKVANQLGSMHLFMGYNETAQQYLMEVYNLYSRSNNPGKMADAINGLAIFYSNIGQPLKAIEGYREALAIYQAVHDTLGQANIHANLGLALIEQNELQEAEYHLQQQGRLDSLLNSNWGLGFYFDFMGYLRRKQNRLEDAYQYHLTSLEVRQKEQSQYNINESRTNLADVLLALGRYEEAIAQANQILEFKEQSQSLTHQQTAYSVLAKAHEALGNYKNALGHQRSFQLISDSIFNRDILETVAEKDAKFDLATQRGEIELLNAEKLATEREISQKNSTILVGSIGLVVFLLLSLLLFALSRKYLSQKHVLAKALNDKNILLREIHHRVKNNLQVISSLLSLQSRTIDDKLALEAINEGKSRVRSMALIHQDLYQSENLTGVKVKDYLIKLCNELFQTYNIEKDRISLELAIEDVDVDVDTLVPLGLIINELVTNSLKYAFQGGKMGVLRITLREVSDKLILEVSDNGAGYDSEKVGSGTFGRRMIASLCKQLKANMETTTNDGTQVMLSIGNYKITRT